ncbi:MAG: diacylglycerol kinase family protein [Ancrocorticia sp.]
MAATHVGIVWNPSKTEKETLETAWQDATAELAEAPEISWFETKEDDPGRGPAKDALDAGVDVVVAAGGDGTVRAVAEYLAEVEADVDLGIVPLGTGNLLARNLEVPLGDPAAALTRVLEGTATLIDVGWAEVTVGSGTEKHAFVVMAGFGIDAHMITETNDDLKAKAGWLAYVESLGRALSASEVINIRLGLDGGDPEGQDVHTFIVGNCGTLQGGLTLLPDADPSDGELDLIVLGSEGIAGWTDTLKNMVWDNGLKRFLGGAGDGAQDSESVAHRRLTSAVVELSEPRIFEVDGDDLDETTRVEISVQPAGVRIR